MRLRLRLGDIINRTGTQVATLAKELGTSRNHLTRLCDGKWKTISREELEKYWVWAQEVKNENLFELLPHAIWGSFANADVNLFRGDKDGALLPWDTKVENLLMGFLSEKKSRFKYPKTNSPEDIRKLMKTENCIFIGSPKHNLATEVAMAALCEAKPFVITQENRAKLPVQFVWTDWDRRSACAMRANGKKTGLCVRLKRESEPICLPIHWLPLTEFRAFRGLAFDCGVTIVRREASPAGPNVTTIVLAGYSGFATYDMACDLIDGTFPLDENERDSIGNNIVRILRAPYRKVGAGDRRERYAKGRNWLHLVKEHLESSRELMKSPPSQ